MDFNPVELMECLNIDFNRCLSTNHISHFRMHALRSSILKKYVDGSNDSLHREAMTDFVALNNQVSEFRLSEVTRSESVFRTWKTLLHDVFHSEPLQGPSLTLSRCIDLGRCGPGASLGVKTTSFLEKMFASELTCTDESLVRLYRHSIRGTRWAEAEVIRQASYLTTTVCGSKLSSVPKDCTKNRTICIEPTLNMFYQLGAKHQIESVLLKRYRIDISTQADINKVLAKQGSVSGGLATLDLKSASDSISIELCRFLLPFDIFCVLNKIRSPVSLVEGENVSLAMISTMGNGFTFPLMTLLFTTLIHAISIHAGKSCVNGRDFGVFGDDLIVTTDLVEELTRCLSLSGFRINETKSFTTGFFRESCGGDFFLGHDVRGIYLKEVKYAHQIYSAFNRLHFWAIRNGISLHNTLVYLKGLVKFQPVPGHAGVNEGFIVTTAQLTSPKRDINGAIYYRSHVDVSKGLVVSLFETQFHGCLIAFLGGYVSGNQVLCRNRTVPGVVKRKTPNWNFLTHPGVTRRELDLSWYVLLSA